MTIDTQPTMTMTKFEAFANAPENSERRFELINGEIIDVPSNPYVSYIAIQSGHKGYVIGEGGGFIIDGHVLAPDVAYTDTLPTKKGFDPTPPQLVVEVISDPSNPQEQSDLRHKTKIYLKAGITLWIVDYVSVTVQVHHPDGSVQEYGLEDTLVTPAILPDFSAPIRDIFKQDEERPSQENK
jgi:Uma2 family endonuclease